jgi:glutamine amidotransferase
VIGLIDYGAGNLRSVEFALRRIGVPYRRVPEPAGLAGVDRIVLPGVGAAACAMRELDRRGLTTPLRESQVPILGICLGMQLLTQESDEGGVATACLGLVPGFTSRFGGNLRVPQIGWNSIRVGGDPLFARIAQDEYFYFLHSHRVVCDEEFVIGWAAYGELFPAAIRHGKNAGVQFHPEKSGPAGLQILDSFCRGNGAQC